MLRPLDSTYASLVRFTSSSPRASRALVIAAAALALAAAACGGPPKARSGADERVPSDGSLGGPPAESLDTQAIKSADWTRFGTERLKPACDVREGAVKADTSNLEEAGKIVATWMEFTKAKRGSRTADGKQVGKGPEPTRSVDSIGMTCSAEKSSIEVNGVQYPFDVAWVVAGQGSGPTLTNNEGAGHFAMFQGLSFKDKKLVLAKVFVPSNAHNDTDDTIVVANLSRYLPEAADEPIVRATGERGNPLLETFVFAKGQTRGFAYQVPKQTAMGRERYLSVGKFEVSAP